MIHGDYQVGLLGIAARFLGADVDEVASILRYGRKASLLDIDPRSIMAADVARGVSLDVYGCSACVWDLRHIAAVAYQYPIERQRIIEEHRKYLKPRMMTKEAREYWRTLPHRVRKAMPHSIDARGGLSLAYWEKWIPHLEAREKALQPPDEPKRRCIVEDVAPNIRLFKHRFEAGENRGKLARELGISIKSLAAYAKRKSWYNPYANRAGVRATVK